MDKDKRIDIVMILNDLNMNGISNVVINLSSYLSKNLFNIYVLTGRPVDKNYESIADKCDFKIIGLPSRKKDSINFYLKLFKQIKRIKPDIVHIHGNSALVTPEILLAKFCGVRKVIMHCHNSQCNHVSIHRVLYPIFIRNISKGLACSSLAGEWIFGKGNYTVIPNGFDITRFRYNKEIRELARKKYGDDKFIIGHVGRFNNQKNHEFILNLFDIYADMNDKAILFLVGTGPDFQRIKNKVENHRYKNRIILYGETADVTELYNAFDVFIFPSKYEGLGLVVVEAQIAGLPCIVSDRVPRDVVVSEKIYFEDLNNISLWIQKLDDICKDKNSEREQTYDKNSTEINRYDIKTTVKKLEKIYLGLMSEEDK